MGKFFTTADPLDKIIAETLPEKRIIGTKHILTGWTNIVIEVTTDTGSYFFRFPRNPFWSRMISTSGEMIIASEPMYVFRPLLYR